MTDMVLAPRELLREVLDRADCDSDFMMQNAFFDDVSISEPLRGKHISRTAELRRIAGLDNPPGDG